MNLKTEKINHYKMRSIGLCLSALAFNLCATPAQATIRPSPALINLGSNRGLEKKVTLHNDADRAQTVTIFVQRLMHPGGAYEKLLATPQAIKTLRITPKRLHIEAHKNARFLIRTLPPLPKKADRSYLLSIKPIKESTPHATHDEVFIRIAYGIRVIVRPKKARPELHFKRKKQLLLIENRGNTNTFLIDAKQCDQHHAHCRRLPAGRIYAQMKKRIKLPYPVGKVHLRFSFLESTKQFEL